MVASTLKPSECNSRTASAMRVLSLSRTETNTVPLRGTRVPPPSWLLAKAIAKERSMPMTSPVERISGPSTVSTPGKRANGNTNSFTPTCLKSALLQLEVGELLAGHDARCDLGDRRADHLGDEGHRARGARVDFEHVDLAVLDRVLHVHQADDVEAERQLARLPLQLLDHLWRRASTAAASRRCRRNGCRLPRCAP